MSYSLSIRSEAEADIAKQFSYYEEVRLGLGHDFILCLEEGFSKIQRNPHNYRVIYRDLRCAAIRRFPFRIFYLVQEKSIVVIAVLHAQKNPQTWLNRA
ncbi:type II toxin-antitoxin system RelE/ParE family toxin [Ketobacter sp. MCCC 1A13808]|uniref:type II toxin-antitoxin system RelE/ParE family toxin n=1 Tax=Ketobacter sp. MCCC 1A13808 TaxID=2602738 RepID=UPI0012EB3ADF|nr:type II toxin-antitoxin system RelE/ParE family toxin [Ketobacter sp. MCCC 1A13808]MVF12281.1 type II toxin-antitoxin system RelE/ParE family toxin [Ketobacter sp. MCCC 1A13808]